MPVTAKSLLEAANAAVPKISGKEAQEMVANGALLVDIRDSAELAQTGKAAGSIHIPRGSLEFKADPTSPTADKNFSLDKTVILHCASGGRAALAGKLLKDMGYEKVYNLGGFKDGVESGGKVEK
jgi:rhodanese-related sulfurtransferase